MKRCIAHLAEHWRTHLALLLLYGLSSAGLTYADGANGYQPWAVVGGTALIVIATRIYADWRTRMYITKALITLRKNTDA